MRTCIPALVLTALLAAGAQAQDKKITIRWYGQSFFQLTTSAGTRIVFDPHAIEEYPRNIVPADLVLISHPHLDHSTLTAIPNLAQAKVLSGVKQMGRQQQFTPVDEKFRDVKVFSVNLFHDKDRGMERGLNSAFILEVDGLRICHLGDLGHALTERQVQAIGAIDILMIPIGGIYTLNGSDAGEVLDQLKPSRLVLPMHYATRVFEQLASPAEFLDGRKDVERLLKTNEITLDPMAAKPASPRIVLLGWQKGGDE